MIKVRFKNKDMCCPLNSLKISLQLKPSSQKPNKQKKNLPAFFHGSVSLISIFCGVHTNPSGHLSPGEFLIYSAVEAEPPCEATKAIQYWRAHRELLWWFICKAPGAPFQILLHRACKLKVISNAACGNHQTLQILNVHNIFLFAIWDFLKRKI